MGCCKVQLGGVAGVCVRLAARKRFQRTGERRKSGDLFMVLFLVFMGVLWMNGKHGIRRDQGKPD